jgi:cyclic 2,3-diphosphoglycerate synthetase
LARQKAVALIDGEHYFPVIESALETISADPAYDLVGAVFIGGTEKVTDSTRLDGFKVPVILDPDALAGIDQAIARFKPSVFIDLSDEPVVGYRERFEFACRILARNISYRGSDFLFEPPTFFDVVHKPSISIIGTGKRTGKTAVSAFICRELKDGGHNPCVVAMGRGGPAAPEVIYGGEIDLSPEYLLELSRQGRHAASDHYEDALMSRITTVGCRRCGGGMAGEVFVSNVLDGAKIADGLPEKLIIFEGSGAALPPVKTDLSVLIAGACQPEEYITGYFGPYRIGLADLAILTMCEEPLADPAKIKRLTAGIKAIKPGIKVVETVFRPKPLSDVRGKRVFVATTAPSGVGRTIAGYLDDEYGCEVVGLSHHLSNRPLLRDDLAAAPEHDVVMTELKAASVDVVTQYGISGGKEVVYMDNSPVTVGGDGDVRDLLIDAAAEARRRFAVKKGNR